MDPLFVKIKTGLAHPQFLRRNSCPRKTREGEAEDGREGNQKTMIPPSLMIRIPPARTPTSTKNWGRASKTECGGQGAEKNTNPLHPAPSTLQPLTSNL